MDFKNIKIFTDGACSGNPGPGGWGAVIALPEGKVRELGGGEKATTNNRMELMATIRALEFVGMREEAVDLYTDSVYVIRGITQWIFGWRQRGWKNAEGEDVANRSEWERLSRAVEKQKDHLGKNKVRWHYVRGHSGVPGNERCDAIAVGFTKGQWVELYDGPLLGYGVAIHDLPESTALPVSSSASKTKAKAYSYLSLVDGLPKRHATWAECEARVKGRSGAKFKKAMSSEDEITILKGWGVRSGDFP